jgi:hypothetical protein
MWLMERPAGAPRGREIRAAGASGVEPLAAVFARAVVALGGAPPPWLAPAPLFGRVPTPAPAVSFTLAPTPPSAPPEIALERAPEVALQAAAPAPSPSPPSDAAELLASIEISVASRASGCSGEWVQSQNQSEDSQSVRTRKLRLRMSAPPVHPAPLRTSFLAPDPPADRVEPPLEAAAEPESCVKTLTASLEPPIPDLLIEGAAFLSGSGPDGAPAQNDHDAAVDGASDPATPDALSGSPRLEDESRVDSDVSINASAKNGPSAVDSPEESVSETDF